MCARPFNKREHMVAMFFDFQKPYDTTWNCGIGLLCNLHHTSLRGRMPVLISRFLANRNFLVRLGSCLSDSLDQETGVLQGSILTVTLFCVKSQQYRPMLSKQSGAHCTLAISWFDSVQGAYVRASGKFITDSTLLSRGLTKQVSNSQRLKALLPTQRTLHCDPDLKLYGAGVTFVHETIFLDRTFERKTVICASYPVSQS